MSNEIVDRVLAELRDVRTGTREVDGVFVSSKAIEVLRRTGIDPRDLAARYEKDRSGAGTTELIGYRLSTEAKPTSEACVHVAFDPELDRVVIYEEW